MCSCLRVILIAKFHPPLFKATRVKIYLSCWFFHFVFFNYLGFNFSDELETWIDKAWCDFLTSNLYQIIYQPRFYILFRNHNLFFKQLHVLILDLATWFIAIRQLEHVYLFLSNLELVLNILSAYSCTHTSHLHLFSIPDRKPIWLLLQIKHLVEFVMP